MISITEKTPQPQPTPREKVPRGDNQSVISEAFYRRRSLSFDQNEGFHGGPSARRKGYRLAMWSWVAAIIDTLILISASCAFVLLFSFIVKANLGVLTNQLFHRQHQLQFFAIVCLLGGWIYLVAVRAFLGFTIGEWACGLRLGQPHERIRASYVFKVAIRSALVILTGVIVLPIMSLLFGRDIVGLIVGLRLFSLR